MKKTRHAEIAGAGFAGLVAATALARRGWSVRVHEANAELRDIGAGLFLWGNGLTVLESLGIYDEFARKAHTAPFWDVRVDGALKSREATNGDGNVRMLTMPRQHLYSTVLAAAREAGADVVTNSRVVGASPDGMLRLGDGRELRADLVIGADGVRSAVRESLPIRVQRRRYDDGIIRVLTSRRGRTGGEWDNIIDYWVQREQPLRVLYVPCDDTTLYLALLAATDDAVASAIPVQTSLWATHFPELADFMSEIGERGRYDAYEATTLDRWSVGKAVLVGDSASAMPPTLGQGAGFAMMNAYTLAVALDGADSVEQGLQQWEAKERALTDQTQARAEEVAALRQARINVSLGDMALNAARHVPTGAVQP